MSNIKDDNESLPTHIIAIGVSAGGLEALENFFDALDDDLGAAFIVIQHLSPDFKSMMDQLLAKHTPMSIVQAKTGQRLLANNVYLVPAGQSLDLVDGDIKLTALPKTKKINLPINIVFTQLAQIEKLGLIAIVLSGTGSDGSRGVVAMKERGALIIAQDPLEAQFNGMPQNAIETGAVDFVLKTKEMPHYIKNYISHPLTSSTKLASNYHLEHNTEILHKILVLIQDQTGLDFNAYKESTVIRRIKHRISINNMETLSEYLGYLENNTNEIELVKQDLLIGVTCFFRDSDTWQQVKDKVIVPIVKNSVRNTPIRVWCAACSTGEEAYTLAMLFESVIKDMGLDRKVKIFASDIDQTSINYASNGIYPVSIADEIPNDYLQQYFQKISESEYKVEKYLRSKVVFTVHNLIEDPPFSNIDFVSCRNGLIYFQQSAQQKVMAFFHFSLSKNGYLLLGSSESPGNFSNYFPAIDSSRRIYQKHSDTRIPIAELSQIGLRKNSYDLRSIPQFVERINRRVIKPKSIGLEHLQGAYLPPTFILNAKLQIVFSYNDTSPFTIKLKAGEMTADVAENVRPDIVSSVLSAAHEVLRDGNKVHIKNVFVHDDTNYSINCFSFIDENSTERYVALSFVGQNVKLFDSENDSDVSIYTPDDQTQQRIVELETAYVECQRMYREALEDLDSTSEELQTSNEELMAANEELQSTNEELQSVNEELYTVNSEYQQKIVELTDTNNDLENLLNATDLAVLFLDSELNIRRYTRPIRTFINIMDFDLNRPFRDLSLKFKMHNIHDIVHQVNDQGKSHHSTFEFEGTDGVEISISPYSIGKDIQGVVISMRLKSK